MELYHCFSSVADGRLVVGGGMDDMEQSHAKVYEYHPDADEWKPLPNMNMPRQGAKSCYAGKTLFVLGGRAGVIGGMLDSVEYLKINATSQSTHWRMCQTPLPLKLVGHELIAIGDYIYLTGGLDDEYDTCSKAFFGKLNSEGDDILWQPLPPMLKARSAHTSFALQNKLFAMGGSGEGLRNCECYDPKTDKWTLLSYQLPCDTPFNACAISDCEGKAIITRPWHLGKNSTAIISFDLKNGFRNIDDSLLDELSGCHVALPLM